jgi:hypothetical protein
VTGNITSTDLSGSIRIELAISKAGQNPIWASFFRFVNPTSGSLASIYERVYRGVPGSGTVTWTAVGPTSSGANQAPDIFTGGQGALHGAIAADQTADNLVYLAGDTRNKFPFSGYIVRGDSTANTWTALTPIGTASGAPGVVVPTDNGVTTAPHADSRNLVFASLSTGDVLLLASDGGAYECTNPRSTTAGAQTWTSINGTIQDTEFYQVSLDNRNTASAAGTQVVLGAAQDNDASVRDTTGVWSGVLSGDGTVAVADPISDTRYFSSEFYFFGVSVGSAAPTFPAGTVVGVGKPLNQSVAGPYADTFPFAPVFALDQGDIANGTAARIVLTGSTAKTLYLSSDHGNTYTSVGGVSGGAPAPVSAFTTPAVAVAFGDKANANVCYVGLADGNLAATTDITAGGGGFSMTTFKSSAGGETVQNMVIDPNDPKTLYVATYTHILVTHDSGATWKDLTGNLLSVFSPAFPATALLAASGQTAQRSIALFNNGLTAGTDDSLLVGGSGGIFRLPLDTTGATWSAFGTALPNVLVTSLSYDPLSDTLLAGTFGRGAFEILEAGRTDLSKSTITVSPATITVGGTATVTLTARDALGNPESLGGLTVTFGLGTGTAAGTFSAVKDNGDGTYTATFTGTTAGTNTITATINGQAVTSTAPTITVVSGGVSTAKSVVTVTPSTIAPGGTATVKLQAKDALGNNLTSGGLTVTFVLGNGQGQGTFGPVTDNHNGTYTATFTGTMPGTNTIGATISGQAVASTAPITITKFAPTITWNPASPIVFGTALGSAQLDATASVPGTFVYTPGRGTVLHAGANQTLSVTFTPTDTADFGPATATATITVTQATPTIVWANPAPIPFGTALSAKQLNAAARFVVGGSLVSVAGTFVYTPAAGTQLPVGANQTLAVSFTPTDATDYTTATASVVITVVRATPVITWNPKTPVIVGTTLSAAQLDATANVAGTFIYNLPLGTVLNSSSLQTLTVRFIPDDSADFTTATKTVTIQILGLGRFPKRSPIPKLPREIIG